MPKQPQRTGQDAVSSRLDHHGKTRRRMTGELVMNHVSGKTKFDPGRIVQDLGLPGRIRTRRKEPDSMVAGALSQVPEKAAFLSRIVSYRIVFAWFSLDAAFSKPA